MANQKSLVRIIKIRRFNGGQKFESQIMLSSQTTYYTISMKLHYTYLEIEHLKEQRNCQSFLKIESNII